MENTNQSKKSVLVFKGLIAVALIGAFILWLYFRGKVSTDDAQISGHITSIAPRIDGQVIQILVDDNVAVKKGDVLVQLDNAQQIAQVELAQAEYDQAEASFGQAIVDIKQARANFQSAQSAETLASKNLARLVELKKQGATSQFALDAQRSQHEQAKANLEAARAQLAMSEEVSNQVGTKFSGDGKSSDLFARAEKIKGINPSTDSAIAKLKKAKASLDQAKLILSYTTIKAPYDGFVANKTVEVGAMVNSSVPLMSIVSLSDTWIIGNFKEVDIKNIKPGQKVLFSVDTYGGKEFTGIVSSISEATGSTFALLPPDNSSGNFVKVTQRFPIKIEINPRPQEILRPGMSVEATIYTN